MLYLTIFPRKLIKGVEFDPFKTLYYERNSVLFSITMRLPPTEFAESLPLQCGGSILLS